LSIIIIAVLITYCMMIFITKYRLPIAVLGLSAILIYGSVSGSFNADSILKEFPVEIIILIFVLSLFTKTFENLGVFDYIKKWLIETSRGKKVLALSILMFTIYFLSLFMNNLTVILLFAFICIELAIHFKTSILPVLVSAIIASNIGGAALPWADTPAVILTLYTDFTLFDFLTKLFLPCFFYIFLLILYTYFFTKKIYNPIHQPITRHNKIVVKSIPPPAPHIKKHPPLHHKDEHLPPHKKEKLHHLADKNSNIPTVGSPSNSSFLFQVQKKAINIKLIMPVLLRMPLSKPSFTMMKTAGYLGLRTNPLLKDLQKKIPLK